MTKNNSLKCIYCKKVIIEADTERELEKLAGDSHAIRCPHCGALFGNPYIWEANK